MVVSLKGVQRTWKSSLSPTTRMPPGCPHRTLLTPLPRALEKAKALEKARARTSLPSWPSKTRRRRRRQKRSQRSLQRRMKDALKKARRARDQVASTQADLEEALEKAKSALSRQGKATASGLNMELGKVLSQLKVVLAGKGKAATDSKAVKKVLEESARVIKASKEEAKELRQLGNRACSVAASKRSRA